MELRRWCGLRSEARHGGGLDDRIMPSHAPERMGRFSLGHWRGYGERPPPGWRKMLGILRRETTIVTIVSSWTAGTRLMRSLLFTGLLSAACATPPVSEGSDLAISMSREVSDSRPMLVVAVTNRSRNRICIRAEILQNPYSEEMNLKLRDARGRSVRFYPSRGIGPPPLLEIVHLGSGETVRARYYLDSRFRLGISGRPFPRGMSAQATFQYGYCDDTWSLRATSAWQPL